MCRTSAGQLYIGTTTGLNLYNHETNDFTRIHKMDGIFVFNILEDSKGNIWFATYNSGIFKYNPRNNSWKNYVSTPGVPHGLPYNKVISIYEDSKQTFVVHHAGKRILLIQPGHRGIHYL